ncbi:uncharacterized protein LOC121245216 [Juglans microcarpa x Juglans regia]|uniref:uncharacterized protein LOC121245216 n=1 Tax=Juglans microcarpa x Juglans regia TaxID=2249226 RepID=UPI001B7F1320|nr:uncharacterized protein LOC121245216 [Juglans microcarpa x Juglans regia]
MAKQQKALDFVNLTQGNMTVDQYAARFMEMGRFVPHLITSIAEAKQRRLIAQAQANRKRGLPYSPGGSAGKWKAPANPNKGKGMVVGNATPFTPPLCRQCGKRHSGECRLATGACFKCGQASHMTLDCPQIKPKGASTPSGRPKTSTKAKVYAITLGEVDLETDEMANAGVIAGKVKLKQYSCVQRCELGVELMSQKVLVAIPDGRNGLVVKALYQDRLSKAGSSIDLPAKERICYMGETVRLDPSMVTIEQVRKGLMSGDVAYLVMMVIIIEEPKGIQGIPVVEDFPRVFADDLPGLPPYRET